ADPPCHCQEGGSIQALERAGVVLGGEGDVVDQVEAQGSADDAGQRVCAPFACLDGLGGGRQPSADGESRLPVGDEDVAAGQGEPVTFAYRRAADHLTGEGEVAVHRANDDQLLVVLAAEVRPVGSEGGEQLGHHRGDAVEVARPVYPFHDLCDAPDVDAGERLIRVHD